MTYPVGFTLKTVVLSCVMLALGAVNANALTLGQAAKISQNAQPAAFNTVEMVAYNANDRVPQWNRAKVAIAKDKITLQACLNDVSSCSGTAMIGWRDMVKGLQGQTAEIKMSLVNAFFNRWQYRSDMEIYNVSEYWASPLEFMQNSGDCEDYAIAKYVTLGFLGFNDSQMRIVAVMDNNRGIGHSVLSVTTTNGKMILDNQTNQIYADSQQTGYAPRFAVNDTGVYTYTAQPQVIYANYTK